MSNYWAEQIRVLEWLEPVRERPWMYIWSTDTRGLHHMIWEIVDNGVDEALAGFCNEISVVFSENGWVTVYDNWRWIPTDIHPKTKKSTVETVFTVLHAWGKFNKDVYKISGWLHWVWASVVNALSEKLIVQVHRNWKIHQQEFERWKPLYDLKVVWDTSYTWTVVAFKADDKIFDTTKYNWGTIHTRLIQNAYLTPWVTFSLIQIADTDEPILDTNLESQARVIKWKRFLFTNGILTYLKNLIWTKKTISDYFRIEKEWNNVYADIAFAYVWESNDNVISFVNNIHTPDGWTHLNWFKSGLLKALNEYAKENKLLDRKIGDLQLGDVTSWLYSIVSIKVPEPQFEWQTKWKLGNAYVRKEIEKLTYDYVSEILEKDEELSKVIIERVKINAKARMAAKLARETVMRKNAMSMGVLPWKLTDCSARKREWTEVYIVEWDSAWGSAKQARNSKFQAIFPLKGKILNTEKSALDKILQNNEVKSLIIWLGAGLKEAYDEEKLRYDKIIIMTDADVDGAHIRTLLLTFFFRYMKPVIENWHLFIAVSPLYKFVQWKKEKYIYPPEYDTYEAMKKYWFNAEKTSIQRYKGLWEMNPDQLWETTMAPETRKLLQVHIQDAQRADDIFTTLMGTEIAPRRNFILTHAKNIRNLDI